MTEKQETLMQEVIQWAQKNTRFCLIQELNQCIAEILKPFSDSALEDEFSKSTT